MPQYSRSRPAAIITVLIAIILAICSMMLAMGGVLKNQNPGLALNLIPVNGFAYGAATDLTLKLETAKNNGEIPDRFESSILAAAQSGFRAEPTSFKAIRQIAFHQASIGEEKNARKIMDLLIKLTKRDDTSNFWLVRDSGKKNDLEAILEYYDFTLRSSRSAKEFLIPTMSRALANEAFIAPFSGMLETRPPWADDFWREAAAQKENALNVARLRTHLNRINIENPAKNDVLILQNLVVGKNFEEAFSLYSELSGDETNARQVVHNGDFSSRPKLYPIDWRLFSSGEFGSEIDLDSQSLLVSSLPNVTATFASQLVHVPSGNYELSAVSSAQSLASSSPLYLRLRCADNLEGREDEVLRLNNGRSRLELTVGENDCEYFWLTLLGEKQDTADGYDLSVSKISLLKN